MKQIRDHVAGLDVHRDTVVACCRVQRSRSIDVTKKTFVTTSSGLVDLGRWLAEGAVTTVVMEATGVYWKPVTAPWRGSSEVVPDLVEVRWRSPA